MGIVSFGIPEQETEWLRTKMGLNSVVEGGTYQGGTAISLSKSFTTVYTIEKSEVMFESAKKRLGGIKNIRQLQGDTREHLPEIVSQNDNILFWLDAHWSGGETYGEQDECPLLDELKLIFDSDINKFAILIDDARLFMAPPPAPHDQNVWPSIADICSVLPDGWDLTIWNDVIFITPNDIKFREYMQPRTTYDWNHRRESNRPSLKSCVRALILSFSRK